MCPVFWIQYALVVSSESKLDFINAKNNVFLLTIFLLLLGISGVFFASGDNEQTSNKCFVTAASKGNGSVACCLQRDEWNVLN